MKLDKVTYWAERIVSPLNRGVHKVALVVLLLLMFLTVGDVIGRYLVGRLPVFQPIPGTFELTEFMLVGYDYVLSYEHEDVVMSREDGVEKTIAYLQPLIIKGKYTGRGDKLFE